MIISEGSNNNIPNYLLALKFCFTYLENVYLIVVIDPGWGCILEMEEENSPILKFHKSHIRSL